MKEPKITKLKLQNLDTLIPQYAANKREQDSYKKICEKENAEIKAIMANYAVMKYEAGGYKATYSIQQKSSIDEEVMIAILKEHVPEEQLEEYGVIVTKEHIDFDALENAIYHGAVDNETVVALDASKEVKSIPTLKVTKLKE